MTSSVADYETDAELAAGVEPCICPACHGGEMRVFHQVANVPSNSCILLKTEEEAKAYPTGDIALGVCDLCGFILNTAFDARKTEYSSRYEETQGFSETFNAFHQEMAQGLIDRHDLHGKTVIEIGCGKGEFLMLLAELGDNTGIGFDPGVKIDRISGPATERIQFIPDFYSEKYADHKADFLACKMTLEHIPKVEEFVSLVRRALGDQTETIVFFQIPEALRILRDCAFEDIYYEHCCYFTPGSIARVFRRAGFDILSLQVEYADQYLTIEAKPRAKGAQEKPQLAIEDDLAETLDLVSTFPERCNQALSGWRETIEDAASRNETVVLWGSGSKAVSFLTTVGRPDAVACVTDVNPYRHNHFMAGTGHRIVPPAELKAIQPDLVIAMNAIYREEIAKDLADVGVSPRLVCL